MANQADAIRIGSVNDVKEGNPLCVSANGKALSLFLVDGKYYLTDNACPHAGGPLCEGPVKNGVSTCPWHGSEFNVATGEVMSGPSKTGVKSYPVEVRGGDLYAEIGQKADNAVPKSVEFSFEPTFKNDHPFSNEKFVNELLDAMKFQFKLYGTLPFVVILQSEDEMDLYLGEVHVTEVDLLKLSDVMKATNKKWGTEITYCLFHSQQFPGVMLLNIRGPKASMNLENAIKY